MPNERPISVSHSGYAQPVCNYPAMEPSQNAHPLLALLATLEPLDEDFPDIEQAPITVPQSA